MASPGTAVAIVVPAHRLGPDLEASLRSIESLDPEPDEFVVVVDGAPDVSRRVAASHRVVDIVRSGPAAARNAGVAATSSEIVLFVDSDVVVPSDLVASVRNEMRPDVDAIIGSYDACPAAPATVSQFRNLLHHWTHQQAAGPGHTFWGACGAIRREAFDAVGGFDERYRDATIEDIELGERLTAAGFRIEVVPSVQVTHLKRWTLTGMVHTDVVKRGVPWVRLMLRDGAMANDLNTTRAARATVALAGVLVATLTAGLWSPFRRRSAFASVVVGAVLAWRDRRFLGFLRRVRSPAFALRSIPLMWIHHVSSGVAFAWAVLTWPVVRRREQ